MSADTGVVKQLDHNIRVSQATHVTWVGVWTNVVLTMLKFVAGIYGRSSAMLADAVHSLSDFITDIVVLFSFRFVNKPVDETHDYGHGKFETLASTFVGVALAAVGLGIFWEGGRQIIHALRGEVLLMPGWIALFAAVVSITVKELLYRYQEKVGKKINSQAIIANAWHHRSDALSSVASFVGIGGAIVLGGKWGILDPVAAVLVSLLILKVALSTTAESLQELLEGSLGNDLKEKILEIADSVPGASDTHSLRTRKIGNYIAIELHIRVDRSLNIVEAHEISVQVENQLKETFGTETLVTVHIDPQPRD